MPRASPGAWHLRPGSVEGRTPNAGPTARDFPGVDTNQSSKSKPQHWAPHHPA